MSKKEVSDSNHSIKMAIGFFGIPRASDICFKSIDENIIKAAAKYGEVDIYYHLYDQERVINHRNDEDGMLSQENYTPFLSYSGYIEKTDDIVEQYHFEEIKSHGDFCHNDFQSLRFFILQLHSLNRLTTLFSQKSYDLYLFIRPDLLYHQSFDNILKIAIARKNNNEIYIPNWQWARGYNDRFAIATAYNYQIYGQRFQEIESFLKHTKRPLDPEGLLKHALDKKKVKIKMLPIQASRVRVGGKMMKEKFSEITFYRHMLHNIRAFLKRWKAKGGFH